MIMAEKEQKAKRKNESFQEDSSLALKSRSLYEPILGYDLFAAKLSALNNKRSSGRFILVVGEESLGKRMMAYRFLKEWSGADPIYLQPQSPATGYTIEQMRELGSQIQAQGLTSGSVGYLLDDVNKLSKVCVNAILKTLEELPSHTMLIGVASTKAPLLPTLLSRALKVRVAPFARKSIEDWLNLCSEESASLDLMWSFSRGSPGRAKLFYTPEFQKRAQVYRLLIEATQYTSASKAAEQIDLFAKEMGSLTVYYEILPFFAYYTDLEKLDLKTYRKWHQVTYQGLQHLERYAKLSHTLLELWILLHSNKPQS